MRALVCLQWAPSASVRTPTTTRTGVCEPSTRRTTSCTASSSRASSATTTSVSTATRYCAPHTITACTISSLLCIVCLQLENAVHNLQYSKLQTLHDTLDRLRRCKGARECTIRTRQGTLFLFIMYFPDCSPLLSMIKMNLIYNYYECVHPFNVIFITSIRIEY